MQAAELHVFHFPCPSTHVVFSKIQNQIPSMERSFQGRAILSERQSGIKEILVLQSDLGPGEKVSHLNAERTSLPPWQPWHREEWSAPSILLRSEGSLPTPRSKNEQVISSSQEGSSLAPTGWCLCNQGIATSGRSQPWREPSWSAASQRIQPEPWTRSSLNPEGGKTERLL